MLTVGSGLAAKWASRIASSAGDVLLLRLRTTMLITGYSPQEPPAVGELGRAAPPPNTSSPWDGPAGRLTGRYVFGGGGREGNASGDSPCPGLGRPGRRSPSWPVDWRCACMRRASSGDTLVGRRVDGGVGAVGTVGGDGLADALVGGRWRAACSSGGRMMVSRPSEWRCGMDLC